uniref:Uncharacterized protein n=1 Tax=viral metagenome TaxID=1070528 RepID=A0A6H1ZUD3_9ZZZZ
MTSQVSILTGVRYFFMQRGGVKDNPFFGKPEEYVKIRKTKARNAYKNAFMSFEFLNMLNRARAEGIVLEGDDMLTMVDKVREAQNGGWTPDLQIDRGLFKFKV